MKNRWKHIFITVAGFIFFMSGMLFCTYNTYGAETDSIPETVSESSDGIVRTILSCVDETGNSYFIRQGNGFFIGYSAENQYVITDKQLVTASNDELEQIRKWYGLNEDTKLTTEVLFQLQADVCVAANVTASGNDSAYALLSPASSIQNSDYLKLSDSSVIQRKDTVYVYGYGGEMDIMNQTELKDVSLAALAGSISSIERNPVSITTDLAPQTGYAGSPLLDANGYVLGMIYADGDTMKIFPVDSIKSLLDTLGIEYKNTDPTSSYNVADESIKQELSSLLAQCQQDVTENSGQYSSKTLENYKAAISAAMTVMNTTDSTKDEYQESINALKSAQEKLKPVNYILHILQVIFLIAILAMSGICLFLYRKSKVLSVSLHPETAKAVSKQTEPSSALVRMDSNEVIWLDKKELRIGKDRQMVDYCIENNSAVSRYHAAIVKNQSHYYLIDNNSTNKTYLNHTVIQPQAAIELNNGDCISIANTMFQFRSV